MLISPRCLKYLCLIVAIIISLCYWRYYLRHNHNIQSANHYVCGVVVGLPSFTKRRVKFVFSTKYGKLLLSWYGKHPQIVPAQKWWLQIKLLNHNNQHISNKSVNKSSRDFDPNKWLLAKGYTARG